MFHKNQMGSIIRSTGAVFYSLLYLDSRQGYNGLKYVYSVISVIVNSLPGNTKIGNLPVRGRTEWDYNNKSYEDWIKARFGHRCAQPDSERHFDGCMQQTFGQHIHARYGANPGCTQPTSWIHATPSISKMDVEIRLGYSGTVSCESAHEVAG